MPYITSEEVKTKRNLIKKEFPNFKISVTREHHSCIRIVIKEAPINLLPEGQKYEQVNEFYIQDHYQDFPEKRDILQKIYNIANSNNGVWVEDSDYGTVPNFYVHLRIGEWDKPFIVN